MKKLFLFMIFILISACTNATHDLAKDPPLIPLPHNTIPDTVEEAKNMSNGFGTFGDVNSGGAEPVGVILRTEKGEPLISQFNYGSSLEQVFDTGISGALTPGKFLRIVVNGKNAMKDLGLKPISKRLLGVTIEAPPGDQCYIDPNNGRYLLPRPSYWSKMDSLDNITVNADIKEEMPESVERDVRVESVVPYSSAHYNEMYSDNFYYQSCDSSSVHAGANAVSKAGRYIYPFGLGNKKDIRKGTISFWGRSWANCTILPPFLIGKAQADWFLISDSTILQVHLFTENMLNYLELYIGGNKIGDTVELNCNLYLFHIYLIWDTTNNLIDSDSVRIYFNNNKIYSTKYKFPVEISTALNNLESPYIRIYSYTDARGYLPSYPNASASVSNIIDNIKWYNHVVSADPSWEYNNGNGCEDASHYKYGEENNYKPEKVEVGYYSIN